jgi:hypothetical protein
MQIHGREFSKQTLGWIQQEIDSDPALSRRQLSIRICEQLVWRSPNGKLKDMSCRKSLAALEKRGLLSFTKSKNSFAFPEQKPSTVDFNPPKVDCDFTEIGNIEIIQLTSRYSKESKLWRYLLEKYHYLGAGSLCGAQLRYLVKSSYYGPIAALAFDSSSFALKDRDAYIGWSDAARHSNLEKVVRNARFLILPTVKVPNLASYVLAKTASRLADDWENRYNIRPVLVETFVDPSKYNGTCYSAANWLNIGDTSGRRDGIAKKIFLKHLSKKWKKELCKTPKIKLGDTPGLENPSNWAEEEFGRTQFYDNRLKKRLYTIAQNFYNKPQSNIPEAAGSYTGTIGAYRFFKNKKTDMDIILQGHTEQTIERIKEHPVVLVPQDSSTLDYSAHPDTIGMGPTNGVKHFSTGLILHDTVAFTEEGTPLGVLDAQCWARDPNEKGKARKRKELPIEQKESMKWLRSFRKVAEIQKLTPDTQLVLMGDREADLFELFLDYTKEKQGPELLVRSERSRKRKVSGDEYLFDFMQNLEKKTAFEIHIPHSGNRKKRDAFLEMTFSEVEITPPKKYRETCDPLKVWAIYAVEKDPDPNINAPIEWMLVTTMPVESIEDANKYMQWYTKRWGIEIFHRVLKSGCRIKDRQLGHADDIRTCLAIDMVVAWRIFFLTMLGRETPDAPCTVFFEDMEWKALCCYISKKPDPPNDPPTMGEATYMLARVGGFLNRKSDGFPGTQVLWRGLQRLDTAVEVYAIFNGSG